MNHTAQKLDPLRLPLTGRQVIEASAGTGKTWTLAALYVRLVLAHQRPETTGLLPPQILVMTFTEAATAELRERIRNRLRDAAIWFDHSAREIALPDEFQPDSFLENLRNDYPAQEWPQCALQLNLAADWMDDAAIYTIHAWSRRMLSQHALDSRILFEQTHLENAQDLQLELTQDYWRTWLYPLTLDCLNELLPLLGSTPENTLEKIQNFWKEQERKPRLTQPPQKKPETIGAERLIWKNRCNELAQQVRASWTTELLQDLQNNRIKGARSDHHASWIEQLSEWVLNDATTIKTDVLERFTHSCLLEKQWPLLARHATFFMQIESLIQTLKTPPNSESELIEHAAYNLANSYAIAKEQRGAFDFSDLLQQLYRAVTAPDGRLAQTIRAQYPVAMVDEFQDTDPWQYGSLDRIYAHDVCDTHNAFIMIGDPKQAIYSFRGADLSTYLQARDDALMLNPESLHTLTKNHRSTQSLVNAVNHIFKQIDSPFSTSSSATIEFIEVTAQNHLAPFILQDGTQPPSFTVWQMPTDDDQKTVGATHYLHGMSNVFADHMAELLNQQMATPGQMAVLVRGQKQANAMQMALRERNIPSVYLSDRSSVYESTEAVDLWRMLRAVATPNQLSEVRAAVASSIWCLEIHELQVVLHDETLWEYWVEQFHTWHRVWQQRGVLPMLHAWIHTPVFDASLAQRLLQREDGERRLSNLLHLGELLQNAAQSLQGLNSVVRFLDHQIQHPTQDSDAQKVRLETDAQCVQIITYHKSKGLQYPLVFVPFAGSFRYESNNKSSLFEDEADDANDASSSVDEDMRLLYVALTRAQKALWLGVAETKFDLSKELKLSALSKLLKRQTRGDLNQQLHALWGPCKEIAIQTLPAIRHLAYTPASSSSIKKTALTPQRSHHAHWWTASFSTLTRGLVSESTQDDRIDDALTDASPDVPEEITAESESRWQSFPAGARYGTLLHDLLEWQALNQWPAANASSPDWLDREWQKLLERKAHWMQLEEQHLDQLTPWLKALMTTPLPLAGLGTDLTLNALNRHHIWPEMEFNFEAHRLPASYIDQLITRHIFPSSNRPALQERTLEGMLTGFMDLVIEHDGRYWVIDYKSNKLPSYAPDQLQAAVLEKRYDVQYVLYILALHRLLKIRLPNYNYGQHMGGAIYMFLRGIDQEQAGVHATRPPEALIKALDKAFQGVIA
jgi:exodeoxyribonuclease V beta subunit